MTRPPERADAAALGRVRPGGGAVACMVAVDCCDRPPQMFWQDERPKVASPG